MQPDNVQQTVTAPETDRMYLAIQWIKNATEDQIEKAYRVLFEN